VIDHFGRDSKRMQLLFLSSGVAAGAGWSGPRTAPSGGAALCWLKI